MTRAPYRLDDVVAWDGPSGTRRGVVVTCTGGLRRQLLTIRTDDGVLHALTVDLAADGDIISRSVAPDDAEWLARAILLGGPLPLLGDAILNTLASAVVQAAAQRRIA